MNFIPFYFDGNRWFKLVNCKERWHELLRVYKLEVVLGAKMAPQEKVNDLPASYFFGTPGVKTGSIPSFGFRREHHGGTVSLEEWAKNQGMDLRKLLDDSTEEVIKEAQ